jgi:hypothetical protein
MQSRSALGSISGAQVSIYRRAKQAVDQALPLLDGLVPLKTDDEDDVQALKAIVRKQLIALVEELGAPGGPRVPRVGQVFRLLAGASISNSHVRVHSESIDGTLGTLRDQFGVTEGFRAIADSVISLAQTWFSIRRQRRSRHSK